MLYKYDKGIIAKCLKIISEIYPNIKLNLTDKHKLFQSERIAYKMTYNTIFKIFKKYIWKNKGWKKLYISKY